MKADDLIIGIDPLKIFREKHPDVQTYWKTVHDDERIKIEIDPIFVVGVAGLPRITKDGLAKRSADKWGPPASR